jgi:hypothetical protein
MKYEAGRNYYKRKAEAMRAHWRITSEHVVIVNGDAAEIVFLQDTPAYDGQQPFRITET